MADEDLNRELRDAEAALAAEWIATIEWLRDQNPIGDVEALLAAGLIDGAITGLEDAGARYASTVAEAFAAGAAATEVWLDRATPDSLITFDATDAAAVRWAQANKLQIVGGLTYEQRAVIRGAIIDGVRSGHDQRAIARDIRDALGLTDQQRQQVASYRRALEGGDYAAAMRRELHDARSDRSLQAALDDGTTIDSARIDPMVDRYRLAYVKARASAIANNDALRAVHQGADEMLRQAIELGQIEAGTIEFTWRAGSPPKTRLWHASMNGQVRALGVAFTSGQGNALRFPGDPNAPPSETMRCKCKRRMRVKAAAA